MNPRLVRELSRRLDAVLGLIEDIPVSHRGRDIEGAMDAKRAAKTALRTVAAEIRNVLPCGEPAEKPARSPFAPSRRGGETELLKQPVPRFVETLEPAKR